MISVVGIRISGIGLNGLYSGNGSGVRFEIHSWNGGADRPLRLLAHGAMGRWWTYFRFKSYVTTESLLPLSGPFKAGWNCMVGAVCNPIWD